MELTNPNVQFPGRILRYVLAAILVAVVGIFSAGVAAADGAAQGPFAAIAVFAYASSAFLGYVAYWRRWAYFSDSGLCLGPRSENVIPWSQVVSAVVYKMQNDILFVVKASEDTGSKLRLFNASPKAVPQLVDYLRGRIGPTKVIEVDRRGSFPLTGIR